MRQEARTIQIQTQREPSLISLRKDLTLEQRRGTN